MGLALLFKKVLETETICLACAGHLKGLTQLLSIALMLLLCVSFLNVVLHACKHCLALLAVPGGQLIFSAHCRACHACVLVVRRQYIARPAKV